MLGQLGCGTYSARIVTRGAGLVVWEEIKFSTLSWERTLDDTSQAAIVVDGIDPGCAAKVALSNVETFEHELALYRGVGRVWLGPVVNLKATGPRCTISARDRSVWWDHRFIHATYDLVGDLATIFLVYFNDAMNADPVAGFTCTVSATSITGERIIDALDHKLAGPEMREISQLGIDWTVIDAACLAGGKVIPVGRLPVITDEHIIGDPDVEKDGLAKVNRQIITGSQPQDDTTGQYIVGTSIYGEAVNAAAQLRDGLLEANTQDDKALDTESATAGAESTVALLSTGVPIVSTLRLGANAPTPMEMLIPGALVDVELTRPAIAVAGIYRIQHVAVSVDSNGSETVSIDVQPIGTT